MFMLFLIHLFMLFLIPLLLFIYIQAISIFANYICFRRNYTSYELPKFEYRLKDLLKNMLGI